MQLHACIVSDEQGWSQHYGMTNQASYDTDAQRKNGQLPMWGCFCITPQKLRHLQTNQLGHGQPHEIGQLTLESCFRAKSQKLRHLLLEI